MSAGYRKAPLRRHYSGCYRLSGGDRFAQFKRGRYYQSIGGLQDRFAADPGGRWWIVEIRNTSTGKLIRFAGAHKNLRDAADEAALVLGLVTP